MSRRWLEREGAMWVNKGVIDKSQYQSLLAMYPERKFEAGVLPILGGLLVGLGILSFIGANWQVIPAGFRLLIIMIVMSAFYMVGEHYVRRGFVKIGRAFTGIGFFSFGAGIFLVGQMYNLLSYNADAWVVWGIAGIALVWLYRSRFMFILSLIVLSGAQIYSMNGYGGFSYAALAAVLIGLWYYWWRYQSSLLSWLLMLAMIIQSIALIGSFHGNSMWWFLLPLLIFYALADWLFSVRDEAILPLQAIPLITAFMYDTFMVFFHDSFGSNAVETMQRSVIFSIILFLIFCISLIGKWRSGRFYTSIDWLLFLPFFLLTYYVDIWLIFVLFIYSLNVLLQGYWQEKRFQINWGTALFISTALTAYGKLSWGFMSKSLFFLIGGVLLLALSWFLNYRKQNFFEDKGGTPGD